MKIIFQKTSLSDIKTDIWRQALKSATKDNTVGIAHAPIVGSDRFRIHVAQISKKIGCHVHNIGDEDYRIVSGAGTLHWGKAQNGDVNWNQTIVKEGEEFTIPAGCAHQLENTGQTDLIILFGCPDNHLSTDRTMLTDSPNLQK